MKTKTLQITTGLTLIFFCFVTMSLFPQIQMEGLHVNHEGTIGWNADGTGPEPAGIGHQVPFPGFINQYFYGTSCDYDDIDPDPHASMAHFFNIIDGFPEFEAALSDQGVDIEWINIKLTLGSLGEDIEGVDWMVIGDYHYNNYYGDYMNIYMQNQLLVSIPWSYANFQVHKSSDSSYWHIQSGFTRPFDASENSNETAQYLAAALMQDIGDESLQIMYDMSSSNGTISGNGRTGRFFNIENGYIMKGSPELPFIGLYADHEGFAGWDADGSGIEPEGNGHGTQRYYGASPDYDNLSEEDGAALGHFIDGGKGFINLLLQLEYRGYTPSDLQITMELISLGQDEFGEDWGTGWCNYYNQVSKIKIDGELIMEAMSDTLLLFSGWSSECTYAPLKNISYGASENAKFVANAFLMDFGNHQIASIANDITYSGVSFNAEGRDGEYYEINDAKIIGKCGAISCIEAGQLFGTLTTANSPYLINGHLTVPDGETLIIEPGTKLAFRGPYHITIEGSVNAIGTDEKPIIFSHSNPTLKWDGFDADGVNTENDSSLFNHCIFEYGYGFGGGPYCSGGIFAIRDYDKLSVKNSTFRYNIAERETTYYPGGGAIALWNCSPLFMNCIFHDNYAANFGGAVLAYSYSDPIFSNCLFYDNNTDKDGGAIEYYSNSNGQLINCTFTENHATNIGGAIDCYDYSSPTIVNTIMYGNRADNAGNEVYLTLYSDPNFYYCNVQGGTDAFGGSPFDGDFENCIDADPLFLMTENHPFQIDASSPCVDAGNPDVSGFILPEVDLAGNPRIDVVNEIIDIGAYEWTKPEFIIDNNKTTPGFSIYPNPITNSANIEFELAETGFVEIEIYNLLGEKLNVINQSVLQKGKHTLSFQAVDLTNGFYFIKLQAGTTTTTQKFLKQ